MPSAEIITIGTEILLGEIQDTNTRYLARSLRGIGLDLYRTTSVGDNPGRIAQVIREAAQRCDVIITTGGLGPTVDDPTRQAVAEAVGKELIFHPELWQSIQERFHRTGRTASENNCRQAFIPDGSVVIENPVGTAPAFFYPAETSTIICLPGVPDEMKYLVQTAVLPWIKEHFHLSGIIKARVLHAATVGESVIDERIGDLEQLGNPTVGLLAHPGQTDIRITAKADLEPDADQMIELLSAEIRKRLGRMIYGEDQETLAGVVDQLLQQKAIRLQCQISGYDQILIEQVSSLNSNRIEIISASPEEDLDLKAGSSQNLSSPDVLRMRGRLISTNSIYHLILTDSWGGNIRQNEWHFSSEPSLAPIWASNLTLDYARLILENEKSG